MTRTIRFSPLLTALLIAMSFAVTTATTATATIGWCKKDPTVSIGGKIANVWVSSPDAILDSVAGPTEVVITVPKGVDTELLKTDDGFAGLGYNVRFKESGRLDETRRGIEIEVEVKVPADDNLPVLVEVTDVDNELLKDATGRTNRVVSVETTL